MTEQELKQVIEEAIPNSHVIIDGDGCNCQAIIISNAFEGKSRVARQQLVFSTLGKHIASGDIHAISMKTWTETEWGQQQNG